MTIRTFEEIEAWQLARELARLIWKMTQRGSFAKDFKLRDQINESAGSIMDNIAEGFGRGGNKEFIHFLSISRASNDETRSQLYRAFDRGHVILNEFEEAVALSRKVGGKINSFIGYLKRSANRGSKFK